MGSCAREEQHDEVDDVDEEELEEHPAMSELYQKKQQRSNVIQVLLLIILIRNKWMVYSVLQPPNTPRATTLSATPLPPARTPTVSACCVSPLETPTSLRAHSTSPSKMLSKLNTATLMKRTLTRRTSSPVSPQLTATSGEKTFAKIDRSLAAPEDPPSPKSSALRKVWASRSAKSRKTNDHQCAVQAEDG